VEIKLIWSWKLNWTFNLRYEYYHFFLRKNITIVNNFRMCNYWVKNNNVQLLVLYNWFFNSFDQCMYFDLFFSFWLEMHEYYLSLIFWWISTFVYIKKKVFVIVITKDSLYYNMKRTKDDDIQRLVELFDLSSPFSSLRVKG
jgi:hypothetical protein